MSGVGSQLGSTAVTRTGLSFILTQAVAVIAGGGFLQVAQGTGCLPILVAKKCRISREPCSWPLGGPGRDGRGGVKGDHRRQT